MPSSTRAPSCGRPPSRSTRRRGGFTLIEIAITIMLIGIIAAIALAMLNAARVEANEMSAVGTLRAFVGANEQYRLRFGRFAPNVAALNSTGYLPFTTDSFQKAGFLFDYTAAPTLRDYEVAAGPVAFRESGHRYFFVDRSGVIRFSTTGAATASDAVWGK